MSTRMRRSLNLWRWLIPGLRVKRWLLLALIGATLFVNGLSRYLTDEGYSLSINEMVDTVVSEFFPPGYLSWIFMVLGVLLVGLGIWRWLNAIVTAVTPEGSSRVLDAIMERRLESGYRIVVVGGGTGLSTMLRGLKRVTTNLTAVVTVSDDGGSSGRLQKELGVLPPGDIRNCLVALADDEALVTSLFRYRFSEGEGLTGHSFGNLFLAAMTGITGNFDEAIKVSSRVLNVKGRVLPSTLAVARLCAKLTDGRIVEGESQIPQARGTIERVYLEPAYAAPLADVITAIREADAIVLGPGSLYTSIMPNLLVDRVALEIEAASAVKIYVCNVMTQPGETDDYTAARHVRALTDGAGARVCDVVIVNDELPRKLRDLYAEEGQVPVQVDEAELRALDVRVVRAAVISETETVRHDPERLADVVIGIVDEAVATRASYVRFRQSTTPTTPSAPSPAT
ncbi:putative gluconeogenesis factor [Vulcanimicrobium alpinum]|uniref:Putative gluconeogenesis factor n=1 Tax=Vulcanimicrobium alpinum TaxID=3016050 RepID=A0AAN1XWH1_UNVUL|nr:gluconeogenesis factor YvcK family protein [Vulcanimicrobium alpinum]BDE06680.1 putative gluconeogenesis factor [Vulcanimicrobium alpinum]